MKKYIGMIIFGTVYMVIMGHFGYTWNTIQYFVILGFITVCNVGWAIGKAFDDE